MTMSSSNLALGSVHAEVPTTVDTEKHAWVMIGEWMGMVMWVVEGKMFWTVATSEVEEKSEVEVSEDG